MRNPQLAIKRVAVLGAGTMGAQIAALFASHGVRSDLLDLPSSGDSRSRLAEEARKRLPLLKPPPLDSEHDLDLIRPGNLEDDLQRAAEADWVIEAVIEDLDVKRRVWSEVAPHMRGDALASTNTSGIPVHSIAEALPQHLRGRFLGVHFFNPPRYLKLLEVIPTVETAAETVSAVRRIGEDLLGRGVVVAHDVPGFIANRIGTYGLLATLRAMDEYGLGPDEVDSITGPAMGRPNSATFRLLDLVGLDIFVAISVDLRKHLTDRRDREAFEVPQYLEDLVARGWLGDKAGQGFYKRVDAGGESQTLALKLDSFEYGPRRRVEAPSLVAVKDIEDPGRRLRTLVTAEDVAGRFAWRVLSEGLAYAARNVGVVADEFRSIDRAMRWGFGWQLGPFQAWDALGVGKTTRRMAADGLEVPEWVERVAERGQRFYQQEAFGEPPR